MLGDGAVYAGRVGAGARLSAREPGMVARV